MRHRWTLALVASLTLVGAALVSAQEATETVPFDQAAHVRVAHFAPGIASAGLTIDGEQVDTAALAYPAVSDWITVPAGAHEIALTPAGEASGDAPAPVGVNLSPMTWTTIAVVGSAQDGTLQTFTLQEATDDLLPGTARVTFFNAIAGETGIDFYRNDVPYTTQIDFGASYTDQQDVADYHFQAVRGETGRVIAELPQDALLENRNYLIAAVGTEGASGDAAPQLIAIPTHRALFMVGTDQLAAPGTVVQAIESSGFSGDVPAAIEAAGLVDTLEGDGPFTVFLPADTNLDALLTRSPEEIRQWVENHVVEGELLSADLTTGGTFTTLAGTPLLIEVTGGTFGVNNAQVLTVNIPATNGVVHLINTPLASAE